MMIPEARYLFAALRMLGYLLDYDTSAGGGRTVQFSRTYRKRRHDPWRRHVEVQLSSDGKHRATHFLGGSMSTPPTYFNNVDGLIGAINNELKRKDHSHHAVTDYQQGKRELPVGGKER